MPSLTASKARSLRQPGMHGDGNGLYLNIAKSGSKSWILRITIEGKRRDVGLGGYPTVSLAHARQKALETRAAIAEGRNPVEERQQAKESARQEGTPTFADVAAKVIELRRPTWSSDRHAKQWTESLTIHAYPTQTPIYPTFGQTPVDAITAADVLAVLTPIWTAKAETATRVKQRMETVFDFCIAQGWRMDNPPAPCQGRYPAAQGKSNITPPFPTLRFRQSFSW